MLQKLGVRYFRPKGTIDDSVLASPHQARASERHVLRQPDRGSNQEYGNAEDGQIMALLNFEWVSHIYGILNFRR